MIENIEARKVLLIVRYNHAFVGFGDRSDEHIQVAPGFPDGAPFRQFAEHGCAGRLPIELNCYRYPLKGLRDWRIRF